MKRFVSSAALFLWAIGVAAFPAAVWAAGDCLSDCMRAHNCSGSGTSQSYCSDVSKAEQVALENCSKHSAGCKPVFWFFNKCGALAADGNIVAWGTDTAKSGAERRAMDECRKQGGKKCALQASQCSL
jgi:hypothetical protein